MTQRNYRREYDLYQSRPEQKRNRAKRNLWNRRLKGKVPAGKEIDHKRPLINGGGNSRSNLRFRSVSANRADKSALYKRAMWDGFVDEFTKTAEFEKLSELEKEAILKYLKRGAEYVDDVSRNAFIRGANKLGMDPLQAVQRANSAITAGSAAGALPGSTGAMVAGAAFKNLGGTAALNRIGKSNAVKKVGKGAKDFFTENYGKVSDSMLGNKAFDATTYNMGRQSAEGFADHAINLGGSVFKGLGSMLTGAV